MVVLVCLDCFLKGTKKREKKIEIKKVEEKNPGLSLLANIANKIKQDNDKSKNIRKIININQNNDCKNYKNN